MVHFGTDIAVSCLRMVLGIEHCIVGSEVIQPGRPGSQGRAEAYRLGTAYSANPLTKGHIKAFFHQS